MEIVAVSVLDDGMLQVRRRGSDGARDEVIPMDRFAYCYPYEGLPEILAGLGAAVPDVGNPEAVVGALNDEALELGLEPGCVPELTDLGDGEPGDNILPLDMVTTGDSVQDEGLDPDVVDLDIRGELPSIDGRVYTAYFTQLARNHRNPYGSRDGSSFAGVRNEYVRPFPGPDAIVQLPSGSWVHEGQSAYEDARITSPGFFWVVAVLPRLPRPTWKNIRTRAGRVVRVQMKDAPRVVVRWLGDDFEPGLVDDATGERRERYSVLPAWALVDIATGEPFVYDEAQALRAPLRLNTAFRRRVLASVNAAAWYWQGGVLRPAAVGVLHWKVTLLDPPYQVGAPVATVDILTSQHQHVKTTVMLAKPGELAVTSQLSHRLQRFVLQAVSWKAAERRLLTKQAG